MPIWKMASLGCMFIAVTVAGYAIYYSTQTEAGSGGLVIEQTDLVFTDFEPGTHEEYFVATNLTNRLIRIVGTNYSCGQNACSGPPNTPVNEIPPKTTLKIPFKLLVSEGQKTFDTKMRIYVEDATGIRDYEFTISGTLLEAISP